MMPRLLVSVRDAAEAREAVAGGADVVDVKDPSAGPLGPASIEATVAAADMVAGIAPHLPWTMACGELFEQGASAVAERVNGIVASLDRGTAPPWLVKAGLSSASSLAWEEELAELARLLPVGVGQAAVAYADWDACGAPPPDAVVLAAARLGIRVVLIDTFDKRRGGLFDRLTLATVGSLRELTREAGLQLALAGRLRMQDARAVAGIGPEIVAVRSLACGGDRSSRVGRDHVHRAAREFRCGTIFGVNPTASAIGCGDEPADLASPGIERHQPGADGMNNLEVRIPHSLTADEMRRRLELALAKAQEQYGEQVGSIDSEWAGEILMVRFSVMGMAFDGRIEPLPEELLVQLSLPGMASLFAGQIRAGIEERLGGLIGS